ncbi:MAG: hypothetical protein LBD59_01445 [Prevotellaceae bacterium]|jgi:hypothetical protein|nr:hypothetical protein [Prevotellaceae bacterium]
MIKSSNNIGFCRLLSIHIEKIAGFLYIVYLKHKADRLEKRLKTPHYIVKWCGKVIIISHAQFRYNRQKGLFPKSFTATELKAIALYCTKKYDKKGNRRTRKTFS